MYNVYRVNVDKVVENRRNVDNMFDLIHTYIHVLLKNKKNDIFVDNYIGIVISASSFNRGKEYIYE